MEGDHLVINGTTYNIEDLHKLPMVLSGYKAAQKEDDQTIAFLGELSPYKFKINNHTYHSSEQWIQYQKAMLFGDSFTANQILSCDTPLEAKQLGYSINGVHAQKWRDCSYDLCVDGLKEKFLQNPPLLQMLKTTSPRLVVEASVDRQWGTGVRIRNPHALKRELWSGNGWMHMLSKIRDMESPMTN